MIWRIAIRDSFLRLDPRQQVRNPVMFVVEIGSVLTTILFFQALGGNGRGAGAVHRQRVDLAVVHGGVRELCGGDGRGTGEGAGGGAAAGAAHDLGEAARAAGAERAVRRRCRRRRCGRATSCWSRRAEMIPADGEVIEGIASVDESAVTGESAAGDPRVGRRPERGDGEHRVLSDWLLIRVTANPGEGFIDRMIALIEGARRQKTPNEIALNILLAGFTILFLIVCATCAAVLGVQRGGGGAGDAGDDHRAGGAPGVPDSDDDRGLAERDRDRGDGPDDQAERDRAVGAGGRGRGRRGRAAAGQDRHDHAGEPAGGGVHPGQQDGSRDSWRRRRSWPRWRTRRRKAGASSCWRRTSTGCGAAAVGDGPGGVPHGAKFVPFTAQTRMSGVDLDGTHIRKGAADAIVEYVASARRADPSGSHPGRGADFAVRRHTAGRVAQPGDSGRDPSEGHRQRRDQGAVPGIAADGHPDGHDHRGQSA